MSRQLVPVILSGGGGTRLWPLSTEAKPKQFHALETGRTLIQGTIGRLGGLPAAAPIVVCGAAHSAAARSQLTEIGSAPSLIIVEPVARNTAPAIAAASLVSEPDAIIGVFPSDHAVTNEGAFVAAVNLGIGEAAKGQMVVFGVKPTRPDPGMGYIEPKQPRQAVSHLVRFVEKPDKATAADLVEQGYLWNSGMFVFEAATMLGQLERHAPQVLESVRKALAGATEVDGILELGAEFGQAPAISIDHAVLEQIDSGIVVSLDCGWNDVGTWAAMLDSDSGSTVTVGEVLVVDSSGSYVRSSGKPVAVIGVDNVIVVESDDGVIVVNPMRAQDVRLAAEWFAAKRREE